MMESDPRDRSGAVRRRNRERFARVVRDPRADLAEVGLLVSAEADPGVDVEVGLLQVDAIADGLRTRGFRADDPEAAAAALAGYLGGELGFLGDQVGYHDPDNGLLARVLARHRGIPITLSALYVAVAHRLGARAYPIALPGHVVVGVGDGPPNVVLDPFHAGRRLSEGDLAELVDRTTASRARYHRAMLRPAPAAAIARRMLNNLSRDYRALGDASAALWATELRMIVPGAHPELFRERGDLLIALGRWLEGALSLDEYLETCEDAEDFTEVQLRARHARARCN